MFYYELYKILIVIDICVEHPWKSAYIRKIRQPIEQVKCTFKILQCIKHNIIKSVFNHFLNLMNKLF